MGTGSAGNRRGRNHDLRRAEGGSQALGERLATVEGTGSRLPDPAKVVPHFTPEERAARGKSARKASSRSGHAYWEPSPVRADPIALLEEQAKTRVSELVPIRYGRMLRSPLAFFRGAAYIMAADLSHAPRSGLTTQLCGDAHLSNFGFYAAPDRRIVFSINDFDETLPGPFEWDLKRLVASFAVAGRTLGFSEVDCRTATRACAQVYRRTVHEFAAMRAMDVWYARLELRDILDRWGEIAGKRRVKKVAREVAKARAKDSLKAFDKLTEVVDGERRIVSDPPLIVTIEELIASGRHLDVEGALRKILRAYRRSLPRDRRKLLEGFNYQHAARKVVGVGSVGTRDWIFLLVGRDEEDPLFLQAKEAQASVLEPFLGKSEFANHGQRVVEGQRMMQSASDLLLGWDRVVGIDGKERDFYLRQLWDEKGSAEIEDMDSKGFAIYAEICGWTLARAHARSGDSIAIAAYLGKSDAFDRAMGAFAEIYADQNERDYVALQKAVESGRVFAELGV
jgi:uncharacterized protein (DUF2252 family)